jgi:hypothetical protein
MNIFSLLILCVGLGLLWFLGKIWWRLPMPQFSKIMLTLSLLCIIPGVALIWKDNEMFGTFLLSTGGLLSGIEGYVRRKKDNSDIVVK